MMFFCSLSPKSPHSYNQNSHLSEFLDILLAYHHDLPGIVGLVYLGNIRFHINAKYFNLSEY